MGETAHLLLEPDFVEIKSKGDGSPRLCRDREIAVASFLGFFSLAAET
jgi:hypothetical protein